MIYYTTDLKKVEYIPKEKFDNGTQGSIHKLDNDKCIKIYQGDVPKFNRKIFELLQELSLKGIYKLYELLYSDETLQTIIAYTMKYYQKEIDNILDEPLEYTLENIDILYNTVSILSQYQILVKDRIPSNVILGKDGTVMIDLDSCMKTNQSIQTVLEVNTNNLLYMFKRLYQEGLKNKGISLEENDELLDYLDSLFSYCKEPAKTLSRRMVGAKKPIDLLYWRC